MNLTEMKAKPINELVDIAESLGIEDVGRLKKQEIIFRIFSMALTALPSSANPLYLQGGKASLRRCADGGGAHRRPVRRRGRFPAAEPLLQVLGRGGLQLPAAAGRHVRTDTMRHAAGAHVHNHTKSLFCS